MADITDLQTMIEDLEDKHDANFAALKEFTFGVLGCMKNDINKMREEFPGSREESLWSVNAARIQPIWLPDR